MKKKDQIKVGVLVNLKDVADSAFVKSINSDGTFSVSFKGGLSKTVRLRDIAYIPLSFGGFGSLPREVKNDGSGEVLDYGEVYKGSKPWDFSSYLASR